MHCRRPAARWSSSGASKLQYGQAPRRVRAQLPTFLIETAKELAGIDFSVYSSIGVTAGASTPAGIIKEVLETMSELLNENPELVEEKAESAAPAEEAAAQPAQEEAPAEKSFDEMSFSEALEASLQSMNTDQKVKGTVVGMSPSEIQVDIGRKHAGYIPLDEFSADPTVNPLEAVKVGDVLDLIIMKTNDAEGTVMLSKKRFDAIKAWDDVVKASEDESILEGVITDVIKGGVLASTNGVRVFIPASLATASRGEPLDGLLHQHVQFRIIEVNKPRRRAVGSIRAVLKEARKAAEDAFWAQAEVGQVYTGTVRTNCFLRRVCRYRRCGRNGSYLRAFLEPHQAPLGGCFGGRSDRGLYQSVGSGETQDFARL